MQYKTNPSFGARGGGRRFRAAPGPRTQSIPRRASQAHGRLSMYRARDAYRDSLHDDFGSMVHDRSIGLGILAMYALFMGGGYWLGQHSPKRRKW